MAPLPRLAATAATVFAIGVSSALPASALSFDPSVPAPNTTSDPTLDPATLAEQLAQADQLLATLASTNEGIATATKELEELSTKANAALEAYSQAKTASDAAAAAAKEAQDEADALEARLAEKQAQLRAWAFSAYTDGGSTAQMMSAFDALINEPSEAGNPVGDLTYLTEERANLVDEIADLTRQQQAQAYLALTESTKATQAATEAMTAKNELNSLRDQQSAKVDALRAQYTDVLDKAGPLAAALYNSNDAAARGAAQRLADALRAEGQDVSPVATGATCSNDESTYPNGQLPSGALCPLWQAPGQSLRPRAAAAFNSLSQAYAKAFGSPICVTDSYRSLAEQYAIKARRGFWAATPGTSNHGLGLAVDLGCGINNFGTVQFAWMKQNAPNYGWFHPSWAESGGRKPEPWHWEFGG